MSHAGIAVQGRCAYPGNRSSYYALSKPGALATFTAEGEAAGFISGARFPSGDHPRPRAGLGGTLGTEYRRGVPTSGGLPSQGGQRVARRSPPLVCAGFRGAIARTFERSSRLLRTSVKNRPALE